MNPQNLKEEQFKTLLNENLDEHFWLYQLGVSSQENIKGIDNDFSFPFYDLGKTTWEKYKPILKEILCDINKNQPKEWVTEAISGDVRDFIAAVLTILMSTYNLTLSLSIPIIALLMKKKVIVLCSTKNH
jgi:hypothetical protein